MTGSYIPTQTAAEVGANPVQVIDRYTIKVARPVPRAHARGFVHGRFLRLKNFLLQNGAILRNAAQIGNGRNMRADRNPLNMRHSSERSGTHDERSSVLLRYPFLVIGCREEN